MESLSNTMDLYVHRISGLSWLSLTLVLPVMSALDLSLDLTGLFPLDWHVENRHSGVLSRHRRYTYSEPDTDLIHQFERHLTAREGEKTCSFQDIVDNMVRECDRLSHKALNESIDRFADENYLVHYNNTEGVYRFYRQRYQDMTESLYHKMIYIVPHMVKKHMRSVMTNITADFKIINIAAMNKFLELDERVNTHFLSYGELFRSLLVESYADIEKNFYDIFTNKPQSVEGLIQKHNNAR